MTSFRFESPWWFAALLLLPLVAWLRHRRGAPVWLVPFAAAWHRPGLPSISRWPLALVALGLAALVAALARPQEVTDKRQVRAEGYDIMLAIDLSGSMLAEDYERGGQRINRLQAIKPIIDAFIQRRPNDRIGLVVFAGRAYTLAPLTFDHEWLRRQTERLAIGLIEDGTAIGDGLGVALTRLEQSRRSAVEGRRLGAFVVLLTDGANNRGVLQPMDAAAIARARGIPVYTIGAGKPGYVPMPIFDAQGRRIGTRPMLSDLDEPTMREIARVTGGLYFSAVDLRTTEAAFAAIDQAQKVEFEGRSYLLTTELFPWAAVPGVAFLVLGALATRGLRLRATSPTHPAAATEPLRRTTDPALP
jgi:Ca-activated chloride channel family protein